MRKLICNSILAAIAVGLVSISYVTADTVVQSVSINNSEVTSKSKNVTPNMNNASPIKQIPRMQLVGWLIMTQDSARNFKGIAEVTQYRMRLRYLVIYLMDISFIQHVLIEMMC